MAKKDKKTRTSREKYPCPKNHPRDAWAAKSKSHKRSYLMAVYHKDKNYPTEDDA